MTKDFFIMMPCGQIRIVMSIPRLMDTIAHQVIPGEIVQHAATLETSFYGKVSDSFSPPDEIRLERKIVPMKELVNYRMAALTDRLNRDQLHEACTKFMSERFKEHVSKKKTEFYIKDLDLKAVEELGIKYLENFGSENGTLCIFKLSEFHKFAALVDGEAFRLYRNDRGTHAELIELRPDRWVLGRYDNDMKIIHEMEGMRRYSPGTNDD